MANFREERQWRRAEEIFFGNFKKQWKVLIVLQRLEHEIHYMKVKIEKYMFLFVKMLCVFAVFCKQSLAEEST